MSSRPLPWVVVILVVAIGTALRFVADSPLWLDEALSVHIAQSGALEDALRQDGHPPLYYVLLDLWIGLVGDGDRTVRALSGVVSVATLPFAYLVGRRFGGERLGRLAVVILAALPFAIRYANETRMYSLAIFLAFAGWWMFDNARRKPTVERLIGVSLLVTLLLSTHYWAIWFLGSVGILLLVAAAGRLSSFNPVAARRLIGAFVLGGVLYLPWVPALLDQAQNTGTPWADPSRPATDVVLLIFELGGGLRSEAQLLGMVMVGIVLLALFGERADGQGLRLTTLRHIAAEPAAVLLLTFAIGLVAGAASGSVFQPRYFSVLIPFLVILLAMGLDKLGGRVFVGTLAVLVVVGFAMTTVEARTKRTQGGDVAAVLNAQATAADVVVFCPDQLGPSTSRYLESVDEADAPGPLLWTFPSKGSPLRVNWRDYEVRNRGSDPATFATDALAEAEGGSVWLVMATTYRTYEGKCEILRDALGLERPIELIVAGDPNVFEPATVFRYAP